MPQIVINTEALSHNAKMTAKYAAGWGLNLLPVLKCVGSHPEALRTLKKNGFSRFGFAEPDEPFIFKPPDAAGDQPGERVLIQLTALSRVKEVAARFGRSFQSSPEVMSALDGAVASLGLPGHEILITVDLGDGRDGVDESEITQVLDLALGLKHLKVAGFSTTLCCLLEADPPPDLNARLSALRAVFVDRGVAEPTVSIGGSFFCGWLTEHPAAPITELRLGDPFILGEDIYRQQALPGGPFRTDVCSVAAEVLDVRVRKIQSRPPGHGLHHLDGQPQFKTSPSGRRRQALLDMGRFHVNPGNLGSQQPEILERMRCTLDGAVITGMSAGYLILDVTDCRRQVRVGQRIAFQPGYWTIAQAIRNPTTSLRFIRDEE